MKAHTPKVSLKDSCRQQSIVRLNRTHICCGVLTLIALVSILGLSPHAYMMNPAPGDVRPNPLANQQANFTPTADGDLDQTFGAGGRVMPLQVSGFDAAHDVAVQTDGKLVVVGERAGRLVVARYSSIGTLDSTFGTGGLITITDITVPTELVVYSGHLQLVLQADGKILLGGVFAGAKSDFGLLRFNPDGTPLAVLTLGEYRQRFGP